MLDHGQLSLPTPALIGALTPVESRQPSMPDQLGSDLGKLLTSRRGSSGGSFSDTKARPLGPDGVANLGTSKSLSMSAPEVEADHETGRKKPDPPNVSGLAHPSSLSAQLHTHPNLAALRTTGLPAGTTPFPTLALAPPILVDPRCSGYFIETVCLYDHMYYCSLV